MTQSKHPKRFTHDTPPASWMAEFDRNYDTMLKELLALPVIQEGVKGNLYNGRGKKFIIETGEGLIRIFPDLLATMRARTSDAELAEYLRVNGEIGADHLKYWFEMGEAKEWGVTVEDYERATLCRPMENLRDYLLHLSRVADVAVALGSIGCYIEGAAAVLTKAVASGMLPGLTPRQRRWILANKHGDLLHRKLDSGEFLKRLARNKPDVQLACIQTARVTARRCVAALKYAYA